MYYNLHAILSVITAKKQIHRASLEMCLVVLSISINFVGELQKVPLALPGMAHRCMAVVDDDKNSRIREQ